MSVAVKEVIAFALETHGGFSAEDTKQYGWSRKKGRLIEECWSSCTRSTYIHHG